LRAPAACKNTTASDKIAPMARKQPHMNVILNPAGEGARLGSERRAPARELADVVEWMWQSWWDLEGRAPHVVEMLTDTACHLVFEPGRAELVGVVTRKFTRTLSGRGGVVGVKLRPAALRRLTRRSAAEFTDRRTDLGATLGLDAAAAAATVLAGTTPAARAAGAEAFVRAHLLPGDAQVALVQAMVARLEADRELTTVAALAAFFAVGERTLQRLFKDYVGAGPKWVIRRCRLLEAAELLREEPRTNLAALASSLGYFDQSHFAREFKGVVGCAPHDFGARSR
jgi:AraC-like DNA-binding protein